MSTAAELLAEYRDLREAGASWMRRRDAYNAYFRKACAEGRRPDTLARYSPDEAERFWARTVPGPDGHVYWVGGGDRFYLNQDGRPGKNKYARPCRWVWARTHGPIGPRDFIEPTCGEPRCVNVEHLALVPRIERRYRFSDDAAIGALQVLALRLGRTPRGDEWDAAGLPIGHPAVSRRFGTWSRFVRAAGLTVNPPNRKIPDERCAEAVAAVTERLGRVPTEHDWNQNREWLRERGYPTSPDTRGVARRLQRPGNRWSKR